MTTFAAPMEWGESIVVDGRILLTLGSFSQAQLAERCSLATETVSRIERGAQGVGLENLAKLAEAMGSSLPKIVDVEGELEQVGALERDLRVAEVVRLMEAAGDAELDRVLRVVRAVLEG